MIKDVIKHALPMLLNGMYHVFPTLAELVFGPDGEPLVKDGKWNLPVPDGVVPDTRTINGHALDGDVELDAEDVGARPDDWLPTPEELGLVWKPGDVFTLGNTIHIGGIVTSNNSVRVSIPLGKPATATDATVTGLTVTVRGVQGAFASAESIKNANITNVTVERNIGVLTFQFNTSGDSPVNNVAVGVQIASGLKVTFQ